MSMYCGVVKQATSAQWTWTIYDYLNDPMVSGAGYDTEQEAQDDLDEQLYEYALRG